MTDHQIIDDFDRTLGSLEGLPDTVQTRPATIRATTPLIGSSQTFIIQTVRQAERGDTVFLEYVDRKGATRIVLPPAVTNAIARQRDALTDKSRSKAAKALAADRKARGVQPGFLKGKAGRSATRLARDIAKGQALVADGTLAIGRKGKRMTRTKVFRLLTRYVQPVLQREALEHARCILATAVGVDVLADFGIDARPLSVDVWVVNAAWLAWQDDPTPGVSQPADAWMLAGGVGQPKDAPSQAPLVPKSLKPWDGHLVVEVPSSGLLLDLDLRAMTRPTKGIILPDAAAFTWDGLSGTYEIPGGGAIRYLAQRGDRSWEQANDWKRKDWRKTRFVDPLIKAIRRRGLA